MRRIVILKFQIKSLNQAKSQELQQKQQLQSELTNIKSEMNAFKATESQLSKVRDKHFANSRFLSFLSQRSTI